MADLSWLERWSTSRLIVYLSIVGALSAVVAWGLILAGHFVFGITKPSLSTLLYAVFRGALYALLLGFGVRLWRRSRRGSSKNRHYS